MNRTLFQNLVLYTYNKEQYDNYNLFYAEKNLLQCIINIFFIKTRRLEYPKLHITLKIEVM